MAKIDKNLPMEYISVAQFAQKYGTSERTALGLMCLAMPTSWKVKTGRY